MTAASRPTDDELGEYVDGGLSESRRAEIAAWLSAHPQKMAEVERLRRLNEGLKGLGEEILDEPVPDRLRKVLKHAEAAPEDSASGGPHGQDEGAAGPGERATSAPSPGAGDPRGPAWPRFIEAAAVIAVFALGGAIGWTLRPHLDYGRAQVDEMLLGASRAYAFYDAGRSYPIEFPPDQADTFAASAAKLFQQAVTPPDLEVLGYRYLGARLAPAADIASTLFLFEGEDGQRIMVLFWPLTAARGTGSGSLEMERVQIRFWLQGGFGFAVIGEEANTHLAQILGVVETYYRTAASGSRG
jgi:anti-sigma factor RsiW